MLLGDSGTARLGVVLVFEKTAFRWKKKKGKERGMLGCWRGVATGVPIARFFLFVFSDQPFRWTLILESNC